MASTLKVSSMSFTDTVSVRRRLEEAQDVAGVESKAQVVAPCASHLPQKEVQAGSLPAQDKSALQGLCTEEQW